MRRPPTSTSRQECARWVSCTCPTLPPSYGPPWAKCALGGLVREPGARTGCDRDAQAPPRIALILVDTSIWIDHVRAGDPALRHLLASEQVLCHR